MLSRAGHDVHFLLRSDYEIVRRNGVSIRSPKGDFNARPRCATRPEDIGPCDWVLVALKTTANDQFSKLLSPLVGARTAVVTLQNGLGNEEALVRLFPKEQILGGLCFVCLNRSAPGMIHHVDHGLILLGEFGRWPEPRTHDLALAFRHAGVPCKVTDNLARAHWEKLVWNIPFNGLGVASAAGFQRLSGGTSETTTIGECLTSDRLLDGQQWEQLARELMQEAIRIANALGLNLPMALVEKNIERTRTMGAYKASTILDFELGRPLEMESLFREPLRQANRTGVKAPRLQVLCEVLNELDARRSLAAQ